MPLSNRIFHRVGIVLAGVAVLATSGSLPGQNPIGEDAASFAGPAPGASTPLCIRSRSIELDYRVTGAAGEVDVNLYYTRDRGASWQCYGRDEDRASPMVFTVPSEGLYGFMMVASLGGKLAQPGTRAHESPQQWVFVDATPPLAQWNGVEPADDFARTRTLQLRWTAHDDYFSVRPIGLFYQSSIDQNWRTVEEAIANTGLYDWQLPDGVRGQLALKLIVRDRVGHAVERIFGPIDLDRFAEPAPEPAAAAGTRGSGATSEQSPGTRPAVEIGLSGTAGTNGSATRPASGPRVDLLRQRMAADLYRQASWHLVRGQYAVAAERLREALDQDPGLLEARHDLAGIFYRQQDYDRAIREYEAVLSRNANYESALYGAALAYVAKRDYDHSRDMLTRLLAVNDRNAEAWLDLGDVLFMMGDATNARSHWRRAATIDSSAKAVIAKSQRRLQLYGAAEELSRR